MQIKAADIKKLSPRAAPRIVEGIVAHQHLLAEHGVDSPLRLAHFMTQYATETGGFARLEENLNYTTTKRLRQVWPSRFKSDAAAKPYVRNPEALPN